METPTESKSVNLMDVLQSKQFESDIITQLNRLGRNDQARMRPYRYARVGLWNAAAVAEEYRRILLKGSRESSTRRQIITWVCKAALSVTIDRLQAQAGAGQAVLQKKKTEAGEEGK